MMIWFIYVLGIFSFVVIISHVCIKFGGDVNRRKFYDKIWNEYQILNHNDRCKKYIILKNDQGNKNVLKIVIPILVTLLTPLSSYLIDCWESNFNLSVTDKYSLGIMVVCILTSIYILYSNEIGLRLLILEELMKRRDD